MARRVHGVTGQRDGRAALPAGDDGVHGEGQELAEDDHHLVGGDQNATQALGRGFAEEDGNGRGGSTDGEAEDDTSEVQDPDVRGDRTADGAEEEHDGQQSNVVAAAVAVREATAKEGAGGGADAQQTTDPALFEGGHVQAAGVSGHVHVGQGARDDAGIVAEEERAKRRDGRDGAQGALLARGRGGRDEVTHLIGRVVVNR